jgi:hypothetical protein
MYLSQTTTRQFSACSQFFKNLGTKSKVPLHTERTRLNSSEKRGELSDLHSLPGTYLREH